MLSIRPYEPSDYNTAVAWWTEHKWFVVPSACLPPNGFVAEDAGKPVAMIWLYSTDSAVRFPEWLVADPASDRAVRRSAIDLLLQTIDEQARSNGGQCLFMFTRHPRLSEALRANGFTEGEHTLNSYIKVLV